MLYLNQTILDSTSHLSFNHLSALATAWQICSLHEVSLDVKPFTKLADDDITLKCRAMKKDKTAVKRPIF